VWPRRLHRRLPAWGFALQRSAGNGAVSAAFDAARAPLQFTGEIVDNMKDVHNPGERLPADDHRLGDGINTP